LLWSTVITTQTERPKAARNGSESSSNEKELKTFKNNGLLRPKRRWKKLNWIKKKCPLFMVKEKKI
jgi:hypothetical protein